MLFTLGRSFVAALRLAMSAYTRGMFPHAGEANMLPAVPRGGRSATWIDKAEALPIPEYLCLPKAPQRGRYMAAGH
jgi:hypothetical protein